MKGCISCGQLLEDNAMFCEKCGAPQPAEQPKSTSNSKNRLIIILVALIAVLVLGFIAVIAVLMLKDSDSDVNTVTDDPTVALTTATTEAPTTTTLEIATVATEAPTQPTTPPTQKKLLTKHIYPASSYSKGVEYVVSASDGYVNLRHGPSTDYAVIREITNGTHVSVTAQEGDWVYATYVSSEEGWIHLSGLEVFEQKTTTIYPESHMFIPETDFVVDSHDGVNMRYGPASETYAIKKVVPNGAHIVVLAKDGGWYYADYNGTKGWVYTDFIREY